MPPAWTNRSRCFLVCPAVGAAAAFGWTFRTCCRTCIRLFPTTREYERHEVTTARSAGLVRKQGGVDRRHQHTLCVSRAMVGERPREEKCRLVEAVIARPDERIDSSPLGALH